MTTIQDIRAAHERYLAKGESAEEAMSEIGEILAGSAVVADPRMAFCPACFAEVASSEADQQTLDARRYRWLRGKERAQVGTDLGDAILVSSFESADELDRAIDAAMAKDSQ